MQSMFKNSMVYILFLGSFLFNGGAFGDVLFPNKPDRAHFYVDVHSHA